MELKQTNHLRTVIKKAGKLALDVGRNGVDENILLYSLLTFPSLSFANILEKSKFPAEELQSIVTETLNGKKKSDFPSDHLTAKSKAILNTAEVFCRESFDIDYIPHEIVFLSYFSEGNLPPAIKKLYKNNNSQEIIKNDMSIRLFEVTALHVKDLEEDELIEQIEFESQSNEGNESEEFCEMFEDNPILSQFAENLNMKALSGAFESIVDFDNKIDELTAILCRKKKPNAILVGEAGTGKSACIQALALKIVQGEAPELLANKVIYSLNLSSMVAGTMYRGQFEERLKKFVDEVKKYNNIILFIDEIHTLVGAGGGNSSSLEASNILKPELARGTISCIGATTVNEYNDTIKRDSALDRRFERVIVREPSKFIMQEILPEIISHYEDFHGVSYSSEFINNVVNYCERYLPNRNYPDKAVTVIDHCGAQAKVNFWEPDETVRDSQRKLYGSIEEDGGVNPKLFEEFNKKLESWQERISKEEPTVNLGHLKEYFSRRANPLSFSKTCNAVFDYMSKEYVGQKEILRGFKKSLNAVSIGLGKKNGASSPDSYLFHGSDSVGKTLFAKTLSDALQKNGSSVIFYSGVQLSDDYAKYKIVSDMNKNTSLCEKIIISPNSVVIIDDFNELHWSCVSLFEQILKEGKITLVNGEVADFSNCKFIFTSKTEIDNSMGFNSPKASEMSPLMNKKLIKLVEKSWFLDNPSQKDLRRILYKRLCDIKVNLAAQEVSITFSFSFIKNFVAKHYSEKNPAGVLNKAVEEELISKIISQMDFGAKLISF
jgi:ATP-dependent Clp protease ATP-binding subunit ClpC